MVMIYYRVMFGTRSSDFRSQGSWYQDLAGGDSGTSQPGGTEIET